MNPTPHASPVRTAIEIAVNLLLIFILLAWCLQIIRPFLSLIVWAGVIAIATYSPFLKLRSGLGGRNKLAVIVFALVALAIILVPASLFVGSIVESASQLRTALESGTFIVPPPNESVKEWPAIGETLYSEWADAATNVEAWLTANAETVRAVIGGLAAKLGSIGLGILQFTISTLIAAAMLAKADSIAAGMKRLFSRVAGDSAEEMMSLTISTVRSVTTGVLGIAFIQAFLAGLGMLVAGVPAAGLWALIILILGIAQLPPLLVLIPVIIYVFSVQSTTVAVVFLIWSLLVAFSDLVLKPLLLGRGVEAPMLVILLGAIGGMLMSGIIGLFVGAVVLALGYTLLVAWLKSGEPEPDQPDAAA
jgi:predicted PurR-regulated permease PerM